MFARKAEGRVHNRAIFLSRKSKCRVTNIYTAEEKQKYHITYLFQENKVSQLY